MAATVKVNLVGVLGKLAGDNTVTIEFTEPAVVRDVVRRLLECASPVFKQAFVDFEGNNPRSNVIILVNEREIGVLEGLETKVRDGDKLVLIPVSHGG